ncbi:MAG: hypothetical protein AAF591_18160 [Verrucomicrobiota bacterium]
MSKDYEVHLYEIMWPNYALVASMLGPKEFGKHYATGSSRYFHGTVVFAEVDNEYRNDFFPIDELLREVKPAPDGSPKRTKFLSTYRVLEHVELSAFKNLYVSSVEGEVLELTSEPYERDHEAGFIRIFQEICPFSAIVLSYMTPQEFGAYITDPTQPKGAPKVMFTQIDFTIDDFLRQIEENPFHDSPIPNVHPHKLREQILELKGNPHKGVKGISLDSAFDKLSFLKLRTGFWIAAQEELLFYPIPDQETLEHDHYDFYQSLESARM